VADEKRQPQTALKEKPRTSIDINHRPYRK